jgi:hypothetical protein
MVIFELRGGIGNQLFVYFAGQYFRQVTGREVTYDSSYLDLRFVQHGSRLDRLIPNLDLVDLSSSCSHGFWRAKEIATTSLARLVPNNRVLREYHETGFIETLVTKQPAQRYRGYFQTYKYYSELLRQSKATKLRPISPSLDFLSLEKTALSSAFIAVHIRRGDYASVSRSHGILDVGYYESAVSEARAQLPKSPIWVFTDDQKYAEKVTKELRGIWFPGKELGISPEEELVIMSLARINIISNSSFSYWAALSNQTTQSVFYPDPWFRRLRTPAHLTPPNWTAIKSSFVET